jgi:uncharacterized Zn finger protein
MNLGGVDFGVAQECRICHGNLFIVEKGKGKINELPISTLTIRCHRCGTVLEQLQLDWSSPVTEKDKVFVEDGVKRGS